MKAAPVAIVQPGKIGDIIICLPIAHYFYLRGMDVIWPVHKSLVPMFEAAVDYVRFLPVESYSLEDSTAAIAPHKPATVLPLAFGFPGYERPTRRWIASKKPFDVYKYQIAGIPFEQKNQLVIRRDSKREEALYNRIIKNDTYHVVMTAASDRTITIDPVPGRAIGDRIEITNQTDSVFDWLLILERASAYFMVDSCMVNLASQMGFRAPGVRCWKPGYGGSWDYPVLRDNWTDWMESGATGVARIS